MVRGHNGKAYSFPAFYLNELQLCTEDDDADEEGMKRFSGWHELSTEGDFDTNYVSLTMSNGDALTHWQPIPSPDLSRPASAAGDGWISVEERLPEEGTEVLLAGYLHGNQDKGYWQEVALFAHGRFYRWDNEADDFSQSCDHKTHWQPLPAAPSASQAGSKDEDGFCLECESHDDCSHVGCILNPLERPAPPPTQRGAEEADEKLLQDIQDYLLFNEGKPEHWVTLHSLLDRLAVRLPGAPVALQSQSPGAALSLAEEVASKIERAISGVGPGFAKALAWKPHEWQTIIAALRALSSRQEPRE